MSATGRGPRGGGGSDFFATPPWVVHRLLEDPLFRSVALHRITYGAWLEPCAGDGAIVRAVRECAGFEDTRWIVGDVREECREPLSALPNLAMPPFIGDFLADVDDERIADVAFTNPPFKHAGAFLEACSRKARFVCLLVRMGFLESESRNEAMRACPPDAFVVPNRPSFDGEGTDATLYGWLLWDVDGAERQYGRLRVLNLTPKSVRRTGRVRRKPATAPPAPVHAYVPVGPEPDPDYPTLEDPDPHGYEP